MVPAFTTVTVAPMPSLTIPPLITPPLWLVTPPPAKTTHSLNAACIHQFHAAAAADVGAGGNRVVPADRAAALVDDIAEGAQRDAGGNPRDGAGIHHGQQRPGVGRARAPAVNPLPPADHAAALVGDAAAAIGKRHSVIGGSPRCCRHSPRSGRKWPTIPSCRCRRRWGVAARPLRHHGHGVDSGGNPGTPAIPADRAAALIGDAATPEELNTPARCCRHSPR